MSEHCNPSASDINQIDADYIGTKEKTGGLDPEPINIKDVSKLSNSNIRERQDRLDSNDMITLSLAYELRTSEDKMDLINRKSVPFITPFSKEKRAFILKLAKLFYSYGCPTFRLESQVLEVASVWEVHGVTIAVLPNVLFISFAHDALPGNTKPCLAEYATSPDSRTYIIKVTSGYNMGKLSLVNQLCNDMIFDSRYTVPEASSKLDEIRQSKEYPILVTLLAYPAYSFTICLLCFQGSFEDSGIAALLSLAVGGLSLASSYFPHFEPIYEILTAFVVSFLARAIQAIMAKSGACTLFMTVILSAIAILLPGLMLTLSIMELSTKHLISGTVKLFYTVFISLLLGLGLSVGYALAAFNNFDASDCQEDSLPSPYWAFLFFPLLGAAGCVVFRAKSPRLCAMMCVTAAIGFTVNRMLSNVPLFHKNPELTAGLAAATITIASNIYARVTRDISIAPVLSGITILTPGSLGVKAGLSALGSSGVVNANMPLSQTFFVMDMFVIATSIAVGCFIANIVIPPLQRRKAQAAKFEPKPIT